MNHRVCKALRHVTVVLATSWLLSLGARAQSVAAVDHHQHLFGSASAALSPGLTPVAADDLVRLLDLAGIKRAAVFSLAYQFSNPNRAPVPDEYGAVRAENDWTSAQVRGIPGRLVGFCGVNPRRPFALAEIARCASDANLRTGLKLHFGNSDVDLDDPEHVSQLRAVFRAANAARMAIVVHIRPSVTRQRPYGARQARTFVEQLLPSASRV